MIDHTVIAVTEDKFKKCLDLYVKAFEPLGYQVAYQFGEYTAGLGSKLDASPEDYKRADLWVKGVKEGVIKTHLALRAKGKMQLFYQIELLWTPSTRRRFRREARIMERQACERIMPVIMRRL